MAKFRVIKTETGYKTVRDEIQENQPNMNGGDGSGDWGHKGRPGQVGGSGLGGKTQEQKNPQTKEDLKSNPAKREQPIIEGENIDILKEILSLCRNINNKLK